MTFSVISRADELPVLKRIYRRLALNKPDLKNTSTITTRVIPVVGMSVEEGARFAGHILVHDRTSGLATSDEHLDLYVEIQMNEDEQISYRGVLDLNTARNPWAIWHNRPAMSEDEAQSVWRSLDEARAAKMKS